MSDFKESYERHQSQMRAENEAKKKNDQEARQSLSQAIKVLGNVVIPTLEECVQEIRSLGFVCDAWGDLGANEPSAGVKLTLMSERSNEPSSIAFVFDGQLRIKKHLIGESGQIPVAIDPEKIDKPFVRREVLAFFNAFLSINK